MNALPYFYLVSTEYIPNIGPIKCYVEEVLCSVNNNYFLKVYIGSGLYGKYSDVERVVLAPRYEGGTLQPINEWPMYVNVCLAKESENSNKRSVISVNDLTIIELAAVYWTFIIGMSNILPLFFC